MTAISGNSGNKRRNRRGLSARPEIQAAVVNLVQAGATSAGEVHRALSETFGSNVPSERTLRDMISEIRRLDPSEPWSLELSEPDEIAAVRPVWAFALANGRTLTRKHAAWAVKVLAAAPDLPINDVWGISGLYALGTFDRTGIDPLIAMGPWRDIEHCERYFKAANDGTIKVPYPALNLALRIPEQNPEIEAPETAAYCARIPEEITVVVEASNKTRHPESHSDKARERSRIVRKDI